MTCQYPVETEPQIVPRRYALAVAADDDVVVRIRPTNVSWREVDGDVIALDLDSSTYFSTNHTGAILWHAMVDGATVGSLLTLLEDSFDVPRENARADVNAFLKLLQANGLLTGGHLNGRR